MENTNLKKASELINKMISNFEEVSSLAYENSPDADPEFLGDFNSRMENASVVFYQAAKELKETL